MCRYSESLDLKCENVIIDPLSLKATVIDFGLSELVGDYDLTRRDSGSYEYVCPEKLINKDESCYFGCQGYISGFKADIWGMGVILYAILYGQFPWNKVERKEYIRVNNQHPKLQFPQGDGLVSDEAKSLIKSMLEINFEKRASFEDILGHPWLNTQKKKSSHNFAKFLRISH